MDPQAQARRLAMAKGELLMIDHAAGALLACEAGELWITVDGDRRDIILGAGRQWRADAGGPLVISAFKPSVLALAAPPDVAPRRQGAAGMLARLRRWKFPPLAAFPVQRIV